MSITSLWHATLRAFQDWWNDNCLRLAASLAYYTALSLAPLALLIVCVHRVVPALHWSARGFARAPGPPKRSLGGPPRPDQRCVGGALGLTPGPHLLVD